jgi:hypothetical protein
MDLPNLSHGLPFAAIAFAAATDGEGFLLPSETSP